MDKEYRIWVKKKLAEEGRLRLPRGWEQSEECQKKYGYETFRVETGAVKTDEAKKEEAKVEVVEKTEKRSASKQKRTVILIADTPYAAMRAKCLDCCGSAKEVELCDITSCALYPFRFGDPHMEAVQQKLKENNRSDLEFSTGYLVEDPLDNPSAQIVTISDIRRIIREEIRKAGI